MREQNTKVTEQIRNTRSVLRMLYRPDENGEMTFDRSELTVDYDGLCAKGTNIRWISEQLLREVKEFRSRKLICGRERYHRFGELDMITGHYAIVQPTDGVTLRKLEYSYMAALIRGQVKCMVIQAFPAGNRFIQIRALNKSTHFCRESEIFYVESIRDHALWHSAAGVIESVARLKNIQEQLSDHFVRVHRSFLVNMDLVLNIQRCSITMINGDRIPVPYKKYTRIRSDLWERKGEKRES